MDKGRVQVMVEDPVLLGRIQGALEREGFKVLVSEFLPLRAPEALVLGGPDGLDLCVRLRLDPRTASIPIVVLTRGAAEEERVAVLEAGADDGVSRSISPRELAARVKAVIRRRGSMKSSGDVIRSGELAIDAARHKVTFRDRPVVLTAAEFRILRFMAARPGRVLSRAELIEGALGGAGDRLSRTIAVHLASIRRKMGRGGGSAIETVRGVGYRIVEGEGAPSGSRLGVATATGKS